MTTVSDDEVAVAATRRDTPVHEILLLGGLFAAYNLGRVLATSRLDTADQHAWVILRIQRALLFPPEQLLQAPLLDHAWLMEAANQYYARVHFPLTVGVLVYLYLRRRDTYHLLKWSLIVATFISLVVMMVLPVAPPRLLAGLGMVDTGVVAGDSVYHNSFWAGISNQYAAMPSLHVGWAVLVTVVLIGAGTSPLRWLWVLHPIVTLFVVVATANHYWLDAVVGVAIVLVALGVVTKRRAADPADGARSSPARSRAGR